MLRPIGERFVIVIILVGYFLVKTVYRDWIKKKLNLKTILSWNYNKWTKWLNPEDDKGAEFWLQDLKVNQVIRHIHFGEKKNCSTISTSETWVLRLNRGKIEDIKKRWEKLSLTVGKQRVSIKYCLEYLLWYNSGIGDWKPEEKKENTIASQRCCCPGYR